jgi:hypothetical protein
VSAIRPLNIMAAEANIFRDYCQALDKCTAVEFNAVREFLMLPASIEDGEQLLVKLEETGRLDDGNYELIGKAMAFTECLRIERDMGNEEPVLHFMWRMRQYALYPLARDCRILWDHCSELNRRIIRDFYGCTNAVNSGLDLYMHIRANHLFSIASLQPVVDHMNRMARKRQKLFELNNRLRS